MKTRKEIIQKIEDMKKEKEEAGNRSGYKIGRQIRILDWAVGKKKSEVLDKMDYLKEQKSRVTVSQSRNIYNRELSELNWVLDY